jgi:cbb3-type cytochrome oxidase cytochrome c subunit
MFHPEKFGFIFIIAGLLFFVFAFVVMAIAPWLMLASVEIKEVETIATNVLPEFIQLSKEYSEEFEKYFGEANEKSYAEALKLGRDVYAAEACWHCHSQFVRPVSKENLRFGKVSTADEYMNKLNLPQLFGTRRVGPDLIRESGKRSNDWHIAHFYEPVSVVPTSVMPSYKWFFDKNKRPNKKGLAITAYVQWLGSWAKPKEETYIIPSVKK